MVGSRDASEGQMVRMHQREEGDQTGEEVPKLSSRRWSEANGTMMGCKIDAAMAGERPNCGQRRQSSPELPNISYISGFLDRGTPRGVPAFRTEGFIFGGCFE